MTATGLLYWKEGIATYGLAPAWLLCALADVYFSSSWLLRWSTARYTACGSLEPPFCYSRH